MEEILELIHNEFINSEEYHIFLQRLDEEEEFTSTEDDTLVAGLFLPESFTSGLATTTGSSDFFNL